MRVLKLFYSEKLSESLTGIEPVTFWSPVRCSNHWATLTQMVSEGYIYVLVRNDGKHMYCQSANQYINVTFAHHLSPCSSMVRASHRRSEGYGFDSRQGLRKFFWVKQLKNAHKIIYIYIYIYQATATTSLSK